MIKIDPNFWKDVENPEKLKYVVYGDSIAENEEVLVALKSKNYELDLISFDELWNILSKYINTTFQNDKEYLFINDELKVVSYLDKLDTFDLIYPKYLMRHNINKNICQLNFNNHQSLKLTHDHSLLTYNSVTNRMIPVKPLDTKYITIINNQIDFDINNLDIYEFLKGLWIANGSVNDKYYLSISMSAKFKFINWINSNNNFKGKIYNKDHNYDFVINDDILKDSLTNVLSFISTSKTIPNNWYNIYKNNFIKFFSFILGYWTGDGTYSNKLITFSSSSLELLTLIRKLFLYFGIYSQIKIDIDGRVYNGKISGDMYILSIISFNEKLLKCFEYFKQFKSISYDFVISESGYRNNIQTKTGVVKKKQNITKYNIKPLNIKSKEDVFYNGYVYDFFVPESQNFIVNGFIVHNTDSIYIHAPNQEYTTTQDALTKADNLANEINSIITNVLNSHLLIKMNVDRDYNKTFFKTESVISRMMLLEAKKNYAYLELGKKGKVNKEPKVKYTGIPVVRSDYSKFAQDFIRYLVEDVAFSNLNLDNSTISNKMIEIIENKQNELKEHLKNYNFRYIATPGRWKLNASYKLEPFIVIGMRLYNTLLDQEVFRPGINGLSIPIKIVNEFKFREEISKNAHRSKYFIGGIPINKINYIVVPTNYENEIIKEKFIKYCIRPDNDIIWEKSFGTVAKNIAKVIKSHYEQF